MRNSIFEFNQAYAFSLQKIIVDKTGKETTLRLDINDLAILRWLVDFSHTGKMETISINGRIYYWVSYKKVIDDLPLLNIGKDMLYKRLKKMRDLGILTCYSKNGSQSYYGFCESYNKLISNPYCPYEDSDLTYPKNSEGSEKIPTYLGKNYEVTSEKIPTNSTINDSILNNNIITKESNIKESKHKYGEYGRILLTDTEYQKLIADFGKDYIDKVIKRIDEYVEENNNKNKYKNFNLVIRKAIRDNWSCIKDIPKEPLNFDSEKFGDTF